MTSAQLGISKVENIPGDVKKSNHKNSLLIMNSQMYRYVIHTPSSCN